MSTPAHLGAPILKDGWASPLVRFSLGFGGSRLIYTTFVQDLASEGYTVVSIDHPHDANIVGLSDGRVITANVSNTPDAISLAVAVRAADSRCASTNSRLGAISPALGKVGLDTSRVEFFGLSLGGDMQSRWSSIGGLFAGSTWVAHSLGLMFNAGSRDH